MKQVLKRDAATGKPRGALVGTLAMAAGTLLGVGALLTIATEWGWAVVVIGMGLLVYVVPQLHRLQSPADGRVGRAGSVLVAAGAGLFVTAGVIFLVWQAVGDPAGVGVLWLIGLRMIGILAFVLGIALFGVASAMARTFPPAAPLLMLLGLVAALAIAFLVEDSGTTERSLHIGAPLFGLGLTWMGYALRNQSRIRSAVAH